MDYRADTGRSGGISGRTRGLLGELHRAGPGPFGAADAARLWGLEPGRAGRRLRMLAERGWLVRARHGLYTPARSTPQPRPTGSMTRGSSPPSSIRPGISVGGAPASIATCRSGISRGVSLLDPSAEARGPIISRWNLRINVELGR